jgi:SOS response regulatory protein OraA/RecX
MNEMRTRLYSVALFTLIATTIFAQNSTSTSISSTKRSGTTTLSHSDGWQSFNVEMRGRIEVTDDDKDIKSMSDDGYLEINKTVFGSRRTIVITPQGGGLKRVYYEGRTSLPYEPEGRKWLAEIMPELLRSTLIGAESRVNRFFRKGGTAGVLEEIGRLESDYVKQHYANLLVGLSGVVAKEYAMIIDKVAASLESDYYLSEFLRKGMDKFLANKDATEAVFRACEKMESDHYKTEIIKEALRAQPVSVDAVKVILAATNKMESDHYKTEVLSALLRQQNLTDAIVAEMINTTRSFDSDHYRTVVLTKALATKGLSETSYQRTLESVKDFDSDHYKTEVLNKLLSNKLPTQQVFNLLSLTESFDSDHYLTIVFQNVLKNQELSDESFKALVERASHVDSDHYASTILRSALDLPALSDAKIISILDVAGNMESDHYITEVLVDAAPLAKSNATKDAYRRAAKKIESETYYGRALRAID